MSFVSTFDHTNPMTDNNTNLEMLGQREQLMEDIDGIVEEFFVATWGDEYPEDCDNLIRTLCDAVCRNFPTN